MKHTNESGRSMVEMLGVLAIIGVLSVGGIAGIKVMCFAPALVLAKKMVRAGADALIIEGT